ncbi:hypothetical protein [Microbulbifer sp. 2205BS26-8]|nr:hypothetical protein [Microbulbifer sp. 2205BS26-8]MDP5211260.1 hypothetical protein [Microbulbifer sp. 2205BS26-8]
MGEISEATLKEIAEIDVMLSRFAEQIFTMAEATQNRASKQLH